jgi:hypothetical protein
MWEHPILNSHIELINHEVVRGDDGFEREMERLLAALRGGPIERGELIERAVDFSGANSRGGLTGQVNRMLKDVGVRFPTGSAWDGWQGKVD